MSNFLIALLVALPASVWLYLFMMRQNGGLSQSAMIVAGVGGFFIFIVLMTVMGMLA